VRVGLLEASLTDIIKFFDPKSLGLLLRDGVDSFNVANIMLLLLLSSSSYVIWVGQEGQEINSGRGISRDCLNCETNGADADVTTGTIAGPSIH